MTCPHCELSKQRPIHGGYNLKCPECCARYLALAWPKPSATAEYLVVARQVYARHKAAIQRAIQRGWLPDTTMEQVEVRAKELKHEPPAPESP